MLPRKTVVFVPDRRKRGPSKLIKISIIFIVAILVFSYGLILFVKNGPTIPQPASFEPADWMSLVPQNVDVLHYLDIKDLANVKTLFPTPLILSIDNPALNITVYDMAYEVVMQLNNSALINAFALNGTTLATFNTSLQSSNLTSTTYGNATFYKLDENLTAGDKEAWVCVTKGVLILAQGNNTAVDGLKSVVDATTGTFFSTDQLKVGYMLSNASGPNIYFSYLNPGSNSYSVNWAMNGITNSTSLDVRTIFNFPSTDIMNSQYNSVKSNLLSQDTINTADSFAIIYGDVTYPSSDLASILNGGVF
jgi:hypothetical protein